MSARILPPTLTVGRAIYGKAHNQRTDYRWLAATPDLLADLPDLLPAVRMGPVDHPVQAVSWRALGDRRYVAVAARASRARDAAARPTLLERDLLVWRAPEAVAGATGAGVLLPLVASLTDEAWWSQRALDAWADPGFVLPLAPIPPIAVSPHALEETLRAGLDALARLGVDPSIGASATAVLVEGPPLPPPPEAIAAMLLASPSADRCSVLGWVPSGRATLEDLEGWQVLFCDQPSPQLRSQLRSPVVRAPQSPVLSPPGDPFAVRIERITEQLRRGEPIDGLDDLPAAVAILARFAASDEEWHEPADLPEITLVPDALRSRVLALAEAAVARKSQDYARDWIRALIAAVSPGEASFVTIGPFETDMVPPLMLAPRLAESELPALSPHGPWLRRMYSLSRALGRQNYLADIDAWWRKQEGRSSVSRGAVDPRRVRAQIVELIDRMLKGADWRESVALAARPSAEEASLYRELSVTLAALAARSAEESS